MKFSSKVADLFCESQERRRFNAALENKYDRLYRLAYAWSHHPAMAQDLVQETMLKALEKRKDLSNLEHLDAWLSKIMRNQFLDNMRFNRRWEWAEESEIDQHFSVDCSESEMIKKQSQDAFYQAMAKLPFDQREVIVLADLQGFSYQEISDITSTPIGTVMSRISRGREKLRSLLQHSDVQRDKVVPLRRN
ncbi:sigma-70 family RNA polymerase sigma factor [Thiomicrorhabdus sp. ZW0627]|uniref:RNA polymerase sigma factor n=1 Tax=Thiomicrorhabdus sp. ZW0627 TaxID=3039774 RepID=UPI002436E32C|nr:sigma-70 family RNA polymerase sigma factor [Thiomicrorhabdus sp. ZW0627]MDG6774214.1 sigma-70 family RNA polymerase sigma factor [Thiomicrorhabdus sp. ZW0627]